MHSYLWEIQSGIIKSCTHSCNDFVNCVLNFVMIKRFCHFTSLISLGGFLPHNIYFIGLVLARIGRNVFSFSTCCWVRALLPWVLLLGVASTVSCFGISTFAVSVYDFTGSPVLAAIPAREILSSRSMSYASPMNTRFKHFLHYFHLNLWAS